MKEIEKNLFWTTVCIAFFFVHLLLVILDANIYEYLFWPYAIGLIGSVMLAGIVFNTMERHIKQFKARAILKYKQVLRAQSFWVGFVLMIAVLYGDVYSFGQFFLSENEVAKIIPDTYDLNEWFIIFPFALLATVLASKFLKRAIQEK